MIAGYETGLATGSDLDGILDLQEANLPQRGGTLSARFSREWFETALETMPVVVARRDARLVGYLISSPVAAYAGVAVVEGMLRALPGTPDAYVYGPTCVADGERGRGLAGAMFERCVPGSRDAKAFCSSAATTRPRSGPMPVWVCRRLPSSPMAAPPSLFCLMSDDRGPRTADIGGTPDARRCTPVHDSAPDVAIGRVRAGGRRTAGIREHGTPGSRPRPWARRRARPGRPPRDLRPSRSLVLGACFPYVSDKPVSDVCWSQSLLRYPASPAVLQNDVGLSRAVACRPACSSI
jgi:hypothetical protein